MVVIFGWGADTQDLGEVAPTTCPNCHNPVFLHHIRSQKRVTLYFVPVVPYGTDEFLACPICRHGLQVAPVHRAAVQQMRASTKSFRRGQLSEDTYRSGVQRFWDRLGVGLSAADAVLHPGRASPGARPPSHPPPHASAPPVRAPTKRSLAGQLEQLGKLHDDGALTDAEFVAAKRRVLDS